MLVTGGNFRFSFLTVFHCVSLYCTVLYCNVLYYLLLGCTVLYCTILCVLLILYSVTAEFSVVLFFY